MLFNGKNCLCKSETFVFLVDNKRILYYNVNYRNKESHDERKRCRGLLQGVERTKEGTYGSLSAFMDRHSCFLSSDRRVHSFRKHVSRAKAHINPVRDITGVADISQKTVMLVFIFDAAV